MACANTSGLTKVVHKNCVDSMWTAFHAYKTLIGIL
jgi:hypothetical protein